MGRRLGSWPVRMPRVHRVAGGRYKYHAVTRAPLPVDVPEDDARFAEAWAREERACQSAKAAPGSLAEAVEAFLRSPAFQKLSGGYKRPVRYHADAIRKAYGSLPVKGMRARHIGSDLVKLDGHANRARRKAWRLICSSLIARGVLMVDPSIETRAAKAPRTDGHTPWSRGEWHAYREHWGIGTPERTALELLAWTAARTNDAVTLSLAHVGGDGLLTFRQHKTGNPAHVPWSCPLPEWCTGWHDERETMHEALAASRRGFTFLETVQGRARSPKGLSNLLSDAARRAGIEGRSAHGLRKSRLTWMAEAGAPVHAIMAWGGHTTMSEAQSYTAKADRKRLLIGERTENGIKRFSDGK